MIKYYPQVVTAREDKKIEVSLHKKTFEEIIRMMVSKTTCKTRHNNTFEKGDDAQEKREKTNRYNVEYKDKHNNAFQERILMMVRKPRERYKDRYSKFYRLFVTPTAPFADKSVRCAFFVYFQELT